MIARRATFTLGEDAATAFTVSGWTHGDTWNGWECPLVRHADMPALADWLNRECADSGYGYRWDDDREVLVTTTPDDDHDTQDLGPVWTEIEPWTDEDGDEIAGLNLFPVAIGLCWRRLDTETP